MKTFGILALAVVAAALIAPASASAQFSPYWGPILSCTGNYLEDPRVPEDAKLEPGSSGYCTSFCDLVKTIQNATRLGMTLAIYAVAPIAFVIGGFIMMTAGGDPGRVSNGRRILWGTFIGLVLVMSSYLIVTTILWLLGNPSSGGVAWPNISCDASRLPGGQLNIDQFECARNCASPKICKEVASGNWDCVDPPPPPPPPGSGTTGTGQACQTNAGQTCPQGKTCVRNAQDQRNLGRQCAEQNVCFGTCQ